MKKGVEKARNTAPKWVAVSGGFDPIHIGHVRMLKEAKAHGDKLVVIINNDNWLRDKKGYVFMPQKERAELLRELPFVDKVVLTDHSQKDPHDAYHRGVSRELTKIKPDIFANGGDRDKKNATDPKSSLYWDIKTCKKLGIKLVFNIGHGGKIQSSSWMVRDVSRNFLRSVRPWGEFYGWDEGKTWKLKTIYIKAGKRLSLQYHNHRSELWTLVSGDATATLEVNGGYKRIPLIIGQIFAVPARMVHRLESKRGGAVVEVALGDFDEKDIVRLQDDHGRAKRKLT